MSTHTVTSLDGTTLTCERLGDGPPVVLVGGALSARGAGLPLARELADLGMTGVVYDRRGRGDSGDTPPYAPQREAEDLAAVAAALRPDADGGRVHAFGMSSGGIVVLEAAARTDAPLGRLVLFEPPFTGAAGLPQAPNHAALLADLVGQGKRDQAVAHFMTEVVGLPPQAVEGARRSAGWDGMEKLAHTLVYDTSLLGDASLPAGTLSAVDVPVLVLSSRASTPALQEAARVTAQALAHGEHRALPGTFHQVPPGELAPVMRDFLLD
ncbi:alpha/beta hydrolase [Streptomyces albus subsp. chlorinus]|uniref:alpha/beta fold hydrolase n=1 Tax=Streptomyces albus TaxID=1888 RepID=UPI0015706A84|nr:alpha/beta hydrolase [Streptomyces albus]